MTDLLTPDELEARYGTKTSTLAQWRYLGKGPKFVKLGRKIFYRQQDIDAFIDANVHQSTAS
ncbi:excisionase [Rhodococcus sp. 06-1059B-a]|nr:excisionase [Rhodococcus sp. 06-1059B-a]